MERAIGFAVILLVLLGYPAGAEEILGPNELRVGQHATRDDEESIALIPMMELDFKTKHEIYELRKGIVGHRTGLVGENYEPSEEVFGQIVDGRPWWGIAGIYYLGSGQRSIEGSSEESRFLCNPYLLVGLCEPHAFITSFRPPPNEDDIPYPLAEELLWNRRQARVNVRYDVGRYIRFVKRARTPDAGNPAVSLIAYNARDFGLRFLYVDSVRSSNVVSPARSNEVVQIQQFIHCGGSCGFPGGCNNMSPAQPELDLSVKALPAEVYVKLWKQKPQDVSAKPDITVVIQMH